MSEACWRSIPGVSFCIVPLEVGSYQPCHWFRAAVLEYGESAATVRMGGDCEAIVGRLCPRVAAEGKATQLQIAGRRNSSLGLFMTLFLWLLSFTSGSTVDTH